MPVRYSPGTRPTAPCSFLAGWLPSADKAAGRFPPSLEVPPCEPLLVFRFHLPSIVLLRSTHPFVPKSSLKSQRLRRFLWFCLIPKRKLYLASVSVPPDLPRGGAALDGDAGAQTTATITSAHQDQKDRSDGLFFACCMSGRYCASEVARGNAERPRRGPKITPQRQHCRGSMAAVVTMAPSTQPPGGLFLDLRNTQPANMQLAGWNGTECAPTNQPDSSYPPGV